jgi:hypothetical protein
VVDLERILNFTCFLSKKHACCYPDLLDLIPVRKSITLLGFLAELADVLNIDGSSFRNPGRNPFGGLIRNDSGVWLYNRKFAT